VDEGDITEVGNLRLNWKARGAKTGFQFAVFEMELTPGSGIPLHKHPFAEFFYVLEGTISYGRVNQEGALELVSCNKGETVLVPPNAPHATQNRSNQPAKMLNRKLGLILYCFTLVTS
jgi:quercetin dioxygenase-like cupin family protein